MSTAAPLCTPAEIAEKRRIAEERLKQNKLKRKPATNNNENRFVLNSEKLKLINNGNKSVGAGTSPVPAPSVTVSGLSDEQKALIEHNRQEALKRKLAKKSELLTKKAQQAASTSATSYLKPLNSPQRGLASSSALPSASPSNSNQVQLTGLGKSVAPSKSMVTGARAKPYQKPTVDANKPVNKTSVNCKIEFISETRFVVKIDSYNEILINEFKKVSSSSYSQKSKDWSFSINDYENLIKLVSDTGNNIERVPGFVLKLLKAQNPPLSESCLDSMEPEMLFKLYDYQKTAVAFGISKGGRFLLADDMGLGKTREALAIADFYKNDWPLLIVTTASSRTVWSNELMSFMPHVNVYDIRTLESCNDNILDAKVVICSYAAMENNMKKLEQKRFGVVIFDESHALKNNQRKRTKNADKLGNKATRAILLTGTPALSSPVELFTQLNIIKKNFASYTDFTKRYCDGKASPFGWTATGCTNPKELEILLRKTFMIRRLKSDLDVSGGLGAKIREKVELARCSFEGMKKYADNFNNAAGREDKQHEILLQWYVLTAEKKKDDVCQYVIAKLKETNEKILIFAAHHCVLDALSDTLTRNDVRYIRIDGKTDSKTRAENVASFQRDPNIRCAVLSILACKEGITLTAGSIVIFAELDWTPSNILQAEGRAHRIGQTLPVKVFYLISPGTADEVIWRKLEEKQFKLNSVGLSAKDERLGQNTATTFKRSVPSTSGIESSTNVKAKPEKAQTKPSPPYIDSQDDTEIDLQELSEIEKKARANVSAPTSSAMQSRTVSSFMNLNDRKVFGETSKPSEVNSELSDGFEIDLDALMELEKKFVEEKPSNTQKRIEAELEGVIFDDDDEEFTSLYLRTK